MVGISSMNLIDVSSIVANIMVADSLRSTRLTEQKSAQDAQISAYQALNTSMLAVQDAAEAITESVPTDASVMKSAVSSLVSALNASLALIKEQVSASGALDTDYTPRDLSQRLLGTAWDSNTLASLADAGVELTRVGTFTFNEAKLGTALAGASAATIVGEVAAFASRVESVASAATSVTGTISREINTRQARVSDLSVAITDLAVALARREESLTIYYSEINARIQALQNQQNYLKAQLTVFTDALSQR